jgi:TPR repeat protein
MEESLGQAMADPTRAADLFRRAAQLGHPLAALRYGLALYDGTGVRRDPAAGQSWLIYAEKSGVPEAALALGDMAVRTPASRDKAVTEKAVKAAVTWYEAAANAGLASAQLKLANAYFAGAGVPRDPYQAAQWYERASNQGLLDAQHVFGILLATGGAGTPDGVEGYKWLLLAERGGHPDSKAAREKAGEKLGEAERKRAEALAAKFTPLPERPTDDSPPRLGPPGRP